MARVDILFDNSIPRIMGILNVTPDSFSDAGKNFSFQDAIDNVARMVDEGADAIDIGGESTRPGSTPVSLEEELARVIPIVEAVRNRLDICISVDTQKPKVANESVKAGAHIINDVGGLRNKEMSSFIAESKTPVIIMHMHGDPSTMQQNPLKNDPIDEIRAFFKKKISQCNELGIKKFILDPGIGFGKTFNQNLAIIKNLSKLKIDGIPLLIGHSRKGFIGKITGEPPEHRTHGTNAITALSIYNGADIIRVHDITSTRAAALVAHAVKNERIKIHA